MAPIFSAERNLWTQTQRKNNDFCFITVNKKVVSKTNKAIESKSFLKSGDIVHCTVVSVNPYVIGVVIKTDDSRSKGSIYISNFANKCIKKLEDEIKVGEIFQAKIINEDYYENP